MKARLHRHGDSMSTGYITSQSDDLLGVFDARGGLGEVSLQFVQQTQLVEREGNQVVIVADTSLTETHTQGSSPTSRPQKTPPPVCLCGRYLDRTCVKHSSACSNLPRCFRQSPFNIWTRQLSSG